MLERGQESSSEAGQAQVGQAGQGAARDREMRRDNAHLASLVETLRKSLLPPRLTAIPGADLDAYYYTADPDDLGGDFYDVFPTGGDTWNMFLGDVCGKGDPGDVAVFYTDGIIETPTRDGSIFGTEGLRGTLRYYAGCPASEVVAGLQRLLADSDPPPRDDVALLALSIPDAGMCTP